MFEYEIVSDGPHRRPTLPFPEQNISQIQGKDIVNGMDLPAFETKVSIRKSVPWPWNVNSLMLVITIPRSVGF